MTTVISSPSGELTLPTRGPFALQELATFGLGHQLVEHFDGVMRLAFCVDGLTTQAGVAAAADSGRLDVGHLVGLDPDKAMAELQELPGIGPFYSALIVIRACGLTDVLPSVETTPGDHSGPGPRC
jgi:hypothetical protein